MGATDPANLPIKLLSPAEATELMLNQVILVGGHPLVYDRLYQPMSILDFGRISHIHDAYLRLAEHYVANHCVSTVWLGCDRGIGRTATPLMYETMIFHPNGEAIFSADYSWEPDAYAGHRYAIEWLWQRLPLGAVRALTCRSALRKTRSE